ncbi:MAG TPA: sulfotransferase domain-containing protein [Acidobacteria bacterium]|nr:sulfotransferase domain-containing protein [Acidobacteriota bacterium]
MTAPVRMGIELLPCDHRFEEGWASGLGRPPYAATGRVWRDQDILISVPIKSGTTWTMNIVHQLLCGGDPDFEDTCAEVPWLEILTRPGMPVEELLTRIGNMPHDRPRAFKSHSAPPGLPYVDPISGKNVRCIVVVRNPEEALVSAKPFFEKHTDDWFDLWQVPQAALLRPDFPTFYHEVIDPMGLNAAPFGFLQSWWPLRARPNVLLLHFADMKRDHDGSIRRIADFLDIRPSPEAWQATADYTSFRWMKQHGIKFDATTATEVRILETGAMVRAGKTGAAADDGMTREISEHLRAVGSRVCSGERALRWLYEGGPLP